MGQRMQSRPPIGLLEPLLSSGKLRLLSGLERADLPLPNVEQLPRWLLVGRGLPSLEQFGQLQQGRHGMHGSTCLRAYVRQWLLAKREQAPGSLAEVPRASMPY